LTLLAENLRKKEQRASQLQNDIAQQEKIRRRRESGCRKNRCASRPWGCIVIAGV